MCKEFEKECMVPEDYIVPEDLGYDDNAAYWEKIEYSNENIYSGYEEGYYGYEPVEEEW